MHHRSGLSALGRAVSSDVALAALASSLAFAVYLRTLLPDLGGYEDTPKLQYLGAVLGTAHAPGYPLHTLLSYLFSWLPFGNPAYQVNLLSAVAASGAVGLVVLLARALDCSRAAAVFAALTLAFGLFFWAFAVLAEVYSLAALLLLGVLYWLVRWSRSGRRGQLYAAAACFALALGNHVTIGVTVPAIALFVFRSPARRFLNPATMATAGLISLSGFLQYLYIVVRTIRDAPWVEARVASIPDFVSLFLISRYDDFVLPFTWSAVWSVAVPNVGRQVLGEFGSIGLMLAATGGLVLIRRDRWAFALLGLSAIGTAGVMMQFLGDRQGFLVPAWAVVAVFLAVGADTVHRVAARRPGVASTAAATLLLAYPMLPLWQNFAANDWSRRTSDAAYLRAVLADLPRPAALVLESYVVDSMLRYLQATEDGWHGLDRPPPDPDLLRRLHLEGTPIYAFERGHDRLAAHGFEFEPVVLPGQRIAERLRELPAGTLVAVAAARLPLPADVADVLGIDDLALSQWPRPHLALVTTIGAATADVRASVDTATAAAAAATGSHLTARAGPDGAFVSLGSQTLGAVATGLAVAVVDRFGGLQEVHTPRAPDFRTSMAAPSRLFRMTRLLPSLPAGGDRWTDVTAAVRHGSLDLVVDNYRAHQATVTVYAAAETPIRPGLAQRYGGTARPTFQAHVFDRRDPRARLALDRWLAIDGLSAKRLGRARFVARVHQMVNDGGASAGWGLAFGGLPVTVLARGATDLPSPRRVLAITPPDRRVVGPDTLSLINASGHVDWMFGAGWHSSEAGRDGEFRWSSAEEAYVVLPVEDAAGDLEVALTVMPRGELEEAERALSATLNGHDLGTCALEGGWQACAWRAPARAVSTAGNVLALRGPPVARPADTSDSTDTRPIGVALRQILIRRVPSTGRAN
jgi:hypothetical protein